MKKAFIAANVKTVFSLVAVAALASAFWIASTPMAKAVQKTPAEIIQAHLPGDTTIASASDKQLLDAVCKAVKQSPKEAGLIVRTAAGARQKMRSDLLCTAMKCGRTQGDDIKGNRCTWAIDVVREWIKQDPSLANALTESISECAPECRDTFQVALINGKDAKDAPAEGPAGFDGGSVLSNINPPPGASGGGGPGTNSCVVCHNNQNVTVPCPDLETYLQGHPGDTAGACQATPITNP